VEVDGEVWGALVARSDEKLPLRSEATIGSFAEMLGTGITNATARSQLLASRARIVHAGDEARRRIQRDLHDGTQQRFVASVIDLQLADERFENDSTGARAKLRSALDATQAGLDDLRELSAGLHPRVLTRGGLRAALDALASRTPVPVTVEAPEGRYSPQLEAAAYFVVAESLANVAKHSQASRAGVRVEEALGDLVIAVRDDGVGGADLEGGTGLRGLEDRIEALGGRLHIETDRSGTAVTASVPLASE
jgi:signal transduction histidine kinase